MTSQTSRTASRARAARTAFTVVAFALMVSAASAHPACDTKGSPASSDVPSVTVSYGDLDLATPKGNRVLYRRIVAAAETVCPELTGSRLSGNRRCVNEAIARAVNDTKSAQLVELQAAHGRPPARS